MNMWIVYGIGFLAQLCFSARLVNQWLLSEKKNKVQTPTLFWQLSLLGAILFFVYGYLRKDLSIMIGQALIYYIYFRNLQLQDQWKPSNIFFKIAVVLSPILITVYLVFFSDLDWSRLFTGDNIAIWLVILGTVGQMVYTGRFVYQWIYSERHDKSSLPWGFWIMSLTGSAIIFTYACFRTDPVLLSAHFFGAVVYIRNLFLMHKSRKKAKA
ncbi:lipid-A-disaccharide synthase N-terminal domain-containing protein [Zunongwangia sp. HGR-M22]|uniref:lipid-A-disaccharide synthase N-terminal domain-containing protein n=1 Tax=Zunongwangia sp. HGR-M22 TaxID=3015168 RepID=UPI0022DD143F|nr:lipid-A-disaccharide synthase N-terminal domain-containing protein [Zunongwangia sp. HGR-M22]WBL25248.1 lipid-A-disaccharide synthase N-terminal domain-containing protein [Zunongwangia sp. HGR-M22]